MANTCIEAESSINFDSLYQAVRNSSKARYQMANSDSLASSAVKTAIDIGAKLILILSESGNTARQVSKFRPSIPIAVLTPSEAVARQTNGILKGCYSFVVDSLEDTDAIVQEVNTEIVSHGIAKEGDLFVCICGTSHGMGANNQVKVERVLSNYWEETGESDMAAHQKGREAHHEHLEPHAGEAVKGCSLM
eukprot:289457_1